MGCKDEIMGAEFSKCLFSTASYPLKFDLKNSKYFLFQRERNGRRHCHVLWILSVTIKYLPLPQKICFFPILIHSTKNCTENSEFHFISKHKFFIASSIFNWKKNSFRLLDWTLFGKSCPFPLTDIIDSVLKPKQIAQKGNRLNLSSILRQTTKMYSPHQ